MEARPRLPPVRTTSGSTGSTAPHCEAAPSCSRPPQRPPSAYAAARCCVTDGPFAETKEQLAGYYVVEGETLDEAIELAAAIPTRAHGDDRGPPASAGARTIDDVDGAASGRPAVPRGVRRARVAILIRILGDVDLAEDAVQDAYVEALDRWPRTGLPDDPAAWRLPDRAQPRAWT